MTDYIQYSTDRWLQLVQPVNAFTNVLEVRAGTSGAWQSVSMSVQTYIPSVSSILSLPTLFTNLAAAIETALGSGTVTISAQDPTDQQDLGFDRLKFTWSEGVWQLHPLSTGFFSALDLGFISVAEIYTSDVDGRLNAPHTWKWAWHSFNAQRGAAHIKRAYEIADQGYSSDRHWEAARVDWGTQKVRTISYQHIPSARLFDGKSYDPARARWALLSVGDNATFTRIWRTLQDPQATVILVHDLTPEDGLTIPSDRWEQVQLWAPWLDYSERITDAGLAGDYYSMELAVRVADGTYAL